METLENYAKEPDGVSQAEKYNIWNKSLLYAFIGSIKMAEESTFKR